MNPSLFLMKIAKLFIAMAAICMTFESECFAEMTAMSLQERKEDITPPRLIAVMRQITADTDFKEFIPQQTFPKHMTLKDFKNDLTLPKGNYELSIAIDLPSDIFSHLTLTPWTGRVFSNTITIEVVK